jgi:hypothetical protein
MTFQEYQAIDAVNFSSLKYLAQSPAHYKEKKDNPTPPTEAQQFGDVLHKVVFRTVEWLPRLQTGPTATRSSKAWKEAVEANPDALFVTEKERPKLEGMVNSILRNKTVMGYIKGGAPEVPLVAKDPESGLMLKGQLDLLAADGRTILDLKSCKDARVSAFEGDISKFQYFQQAAQYLTLARLCGYPHKTLLFLAIEKTPPYGCMLHALEPCSLGLGIDANRRDLAKLKECIEKNEWPSYSEEVQICSVKPWAMPEEDE